jgi:Uncharacterized protein family, UPF0114
MKNAAPRPGHVTHPTEADMIEPPAPYRPNPTLKRVETGFESLLFNSRWLMAPFYFGLVVSLAVLMLKFFMVLYEFVIHAPARKSPTSSLACSA